MLFLTVNTAATPRSNFGQMKDDIERLNRWCWQHNKALNLERGLVLHHNLSRGTTAQQPRRSSSSRSMAYHQLSRSFRLSFLAIPCIQYLATPPICITIFHKKLCISPYFKVDKEVLKCLQDTFYPLNQYPTNCGMLTKSLTIWFILWLRLGHLKV